MQCWSGMKCYGNPPFSAEVMLQVVQKIRMEKVEVVLVVPNWPGQAWFQELMILPVTVMHLPGGIPLFASGPAGGRVLSPPPKWGVLAVHVQPALAGYMGDSHLRRGPMAPGLSHAPPPAAFLESQSMSFLRDRLAMLQKQLQMHLHKPITHAIPAPGPPVPVLKGWQQCVYVQARNAPAGS
jgi:hypothetical protein